MSLRILSDTDVIPYLLGGAKRYALWLGAGASVESGIQTAPQICEAIRQDLLKRQSFPASDVEAIAAWANQTLGWSDPERRYTTCILKAHPNRATRIAYFRDLLRQSRPAFCHYASAILMSNGVLDSTSLTTNFDHLLEHAFGELNLADYQSIRSDAETPFLNASDERCFILKLHGDIDTNNILNTTEETLEISEDMRGLVFKCVRNKGLVVLGSAGNEKSIWKLFENLEKAMAADPSLLSFGLFWGVFMGDKKPAALSAAELTALVTARIQETGINRNIVEMLERSGNELFAFFPVWGAGSFLLDTVLATSSSRLIGISTAYLDHEMRLRHVFRNAGLSETTVDLHLAHLRELRRKVSGPEQKSSANAEEILRATHSNGRLSCHVVYGDITSRRMMDSSAFAGRRRAVVSPEDTYISAGGGVAYGLLKKAGELLISNELSKLAPIPHRTVAVTSGGRLPVHYIMHAAALRICEGPSYDVSQNDVRDTALEVLAKAVALEVGVVWVPLMGAGVASLSPDQSLTGLLEAVRQFSAKAVNFGADLTVVLVIFKERLIAHRDVISITSQVLGDEFTVQPTVI